MKGGGIRRDARDGGDKYWGRRCAGGGGWVIQRYRYRLIPDVIRHINEPYGLYNIL